MIDLKQQLAKKQWQLDTLLDVFELVGVSDSYLCSAGLQLVLLNLAEHLKVCGEEHLQPVTLVYCVVPAPTQDSPALVYVVVPAPTQDNPALIYVVVPEMQNNPALIYLIVPAPTQDNPALVYVVVLSNARQSGIDLLLSLPMQDNPALVYM